MSNSLPGKLLAVLLLVLLTFSIFAAGKRGLAAVVALEPRYAIERWRSGYIKLNATAFKDMEDKLLQAHLLWPENPLIIEDLGRLIADSAASGALAEAEVMVSRQRALARFRQALALQPGSGYAYVNFAAQKLYLTQIDQNFLAALRQARYRAPWIRSVSLLTVDLGLASWPLLRPAMRELIRQTIRAHGHWPMFDHKPALRDLLQRYDRPDLACLLDKAPTGCPMQ